MSTGEPAPRPRLRPMRESDLPAVVTIEQQAYPYPWSQATFRQCLRAGLACWVLVTGGTVEGYGVMALRQARAHVLNLCVRPPSRGRGLGTRILSHLLAQARRGGARLALLEVRRSNATARSLYRRMGFTKAGIREAYYPARAGREDALIMVRRL